MQDKQDKLTKIFQRAKYEPETNLTEHVWHAVTLRDEREARIKLWAFSSVMLASLAGLVPAFQMLFNDLAHSGFYDYFSLIFSDGASVLSYWKELALSLTESLPIMSIIFTLTLLFVCFLSLKYLIRQIGAGSRVLLSI